MYLKSDMISRGQKVGVVDRAKIIVIISPAWLDWSSPGIFIALFFWLLGLNHTLLPLLEFCFPLFVQVPSV